MLIRTQTNKTVADAALALHTAVQNNHFGVLQVYNLAEMLAHRGVELDHECMIFEICEPHQAKQILDRNLGISAALPCRISIYDEGHGTVLATLPPTALLDLVGAPEELQALAADLERSLRKILAEAATS